MKKLLLSVFTLFLSCAFVFPQAQTNICGTTEHMNYLKSQRPNLQKELQQAETQIQKWISNNPNYKLSSTINTIPVVVHVVYHTAIQNISDAQVLSEIDVLNEDFSRTNADTINTPPPFALVAGSVPFSFCMAQRDPAGAPTNGIERRSTTVNAFTANDAVKHYSSGGLDAWDVTSYLNIWVCTFGGSGLLGYGEFPTATPSNTFGVVIQYDAFGRVGTLMAGYNLGRTTTHEFSHCFNLFHIWGDDGGACTGSDLVSDTPNQADANFGCLTFPHSDACTATANGIMFMDYMDYTSDNCKNMFTQGQATRMTAALNSFYPTLLNSNGCDPVILQQTDAGSPAIISPSGLLCSSSDTPVVRLRNWGTDTLTSVTINYQLDANPLQTYSWNGQLASLAITDVTLPVIAVSAGNHNFICYTTNPNGTSDGNALNDTSYSVFNVVATGNAAPFSYGFEPVTFPPAGWILDNQDGLVSWARTTVAAKTGLASMWFNSINYPCNGCIDIITLPNVDLTTLSSPQMTFQVAYRMLSNPALIPNWSDSLRVDISTDCGETWTNLYFKYSTNLTTIVPTFSTTPFVPTQSNWRLETINLAPYAANDNVLLRFKVSSDYENNMYIDDINIDNATAINEIKNAGSFSIYPNPAFGILNIKMNSIQGENSAVKIFNMLGSNVFEKKIKANSNLIQLNLSELKNGVYSLNLKSDSENRTVKLIISR